MVANVGGRSRHYESQKGLALRPQLETGPAVALLPVSASSAVSGCSAHTPFFLLRRIGLGDSDPEPSRQNRAGGRDGWPSKLLSSNSGETWQWADNANVENHPRDIGARQAGRQIRAAYLRL